MTPRVDELRFFAVVAANPTLTAASRQLGSSLPVVSKRLTALEDRLGVRLVSRGTRRLSLTPEGDLLARGVDGILADIQRLEDEVAGEATDVRGSLVVESTLGLGRAHIGPLLGQFSNLHPDVDIRLTTTPSPPTPHRREFDVAIHVGRTNDSSLRMQRLAPNRRVVCASPEYIRAHGEPRTVDDLITHNCIVLRENYSDYALWQFGDEAKDLRVRVGGSLTSNDGDVVTRWAIEGHGLIMRSQWHVQPLLERGVLVQVLAHTPTPPADVYALHAGEQHVPTRVAALLDFLAAELPRRLGGKDC